jgi:hypothetical protein
MQSARRIQCKVPECSVTKSKLKDRVRTRSSVVTDRLRHDRACIAK